MTSPTLEMDPSLENASVAQLEERLVETTKAKEANATVGKQLDEKLRSAFKNAPRRPNMTAELIDRTMEELELRRSTTSMPLADENRILRELQQLGEKRTQLETFNNFQSWVDKTKTERQERFAKHKELETQIRQLQNAKRRATLAQALGQSTSDLVTIQVSLPKARIGNVVGRGYANLRQLESDHQAIIEIDDTALVANIVSVVSQAELAKAAIEDITLATNVVVGLHPDTMKLLLSQKSKLLHELEQSLHLHLDVNKSDGILSASASPRKEKQLRLALDQVAAKKEDIGLPAEVVPKLIGRKGETVNKLMEESDCLIDIDKVTNSVRLCGSKANVAKAKTFVLDLVEEFSTRTDVVRPSDLDVFPDDTYEVYKFTFFAEFLMADKAAQLKKLRSTVGEARVSVSKDEKKIVATGTKAQLTTFRPTLKTFITSFEEKHFVHQVSDGRILSLIIGRKGAKIKELEKEAMSAGGHVRIDVDGLYVCVYGEPKDVLESTKNQIERIDATNQRSYYSTCQYLVTVLLNSKREKLQDIESESGCKLQLPPPPSGGRDSVDASARVKITLTGTIEAIAEAKQLLTALDDAHLVHHVPLDADEVPIVIGQKGKTVSELESKSGAKVRVLRNKEGEKGAELELIGTKEQLEVVQASLDTLLQTQNRSLLQFDAFTVGCLIGKKGERIKALREKHPEATLDAFPVRGQVRVKASSQEAMNICLDDVMQTLRESSVVETIHASDSVNFKQLIDKYEALEARLHELEAQGGEGMRVNFLEDGKIVKLRGCALGIGPLKKFLEMLNEADDVLMESMKLPSLSTAKVLMTGEKEDAPAKLNENALRICKQTKCEIRVKQSGEDAEVVIEGSSVANVYNARAEVEKLLQFYFSDRIALLVDLPPAAIPRLFEMAPSLRSKWNAVLSLPTKTSMKVFTKSKEDTEAAANVLRSELATWKQQHVQVPVPSWVVPLLVGKNGESIRKLAATAEGAKLDVSPFDNHKDRFITVHARDDDVLQRAVDLVKSEIDKHTELASSVEANSDVADVLLNVRKEATSSGLQFHVLDKEAGKEIVVYGTDFESRERIVEKLEHLRDTTQVRVIELPDSNAYKSIVGALIGKSGTHIKALQKQFPDVTIDILRDERRITLKGPTESVDQVKSVMEDKIQELLPRLDEQEQQEQAPVSPTESKTKVEKDLKDEDKENEVDTSVSSGNQNQSVPKPTVVGGTPSMSLPKMSKKQRQRMRKRAEKTNEVLSMIMGDDKTENPSSSTKESNGNGSYYHSSSGYSLRL